MIQTDQIWRDDYLRKRFEITSQHHDTMIRSTDHFRSYALHVLQLSNLVQDLPTFANKVKTSK